MNESPTVSVWDPLVRIGHWALVIGIVLAFFTAEDFPESHEFIGYTIAVIVGIRILWGLVGSRHARFTDFVYRPSAVISYLRDMVAFRSPRYLGHSPAGGAMVVAILLVLVVVVSTGIAADEVRDSNPLASGAVSTQLEGKDNVRSAEGEKSESLIGGVHEMMTNLLLILVALHVAGVAVSSFAHRENLVRAMIDGRKRSADERP